MHFSTLASVAILMASRSISAPVPSENAGSPEAPVPSIDKRQDAMGTAKVINNCAFPVNINRVDLQNIATQTVEPNGNWEEAYLVPPVGGISIKIDAGDAGNIAQFEYTVDQTLNTVFYDLSLINGDPFVADYQGMIPDDPSCPSVICQPNEWPCAAAYNDPSQNQATHGCGLDKNLVFSLCSASS